MSSETTHSFTVKTCVPSETDANSTSKSELITNESFSDIEGGIEHDISKESSTRSRHTKHTLMDRMLAEAVGTGMLVHFGCGSVCVALYTEALVGLGQSTTIWALGSALALYCTATTSGGHLNPAVSLAFAAVRPTDFSWRHLLPYWGAQFIGAVIAAGVNYGLFASAIAEFENKNGIVRGIDSVASAKGFGAYRTYSPSPGQAFFCEAWGTALLTFIIFSITNKKNDIPSAAIPALVGISIGSIISIIGALSGGGINPARDFGARMVSLMAGWGADAMQDVWVTILAPLLGGPIGAVFADKIFFREKQFAF